MSGSVHSILSMPNSTVGAFKLNVSPYLLDVIAVVVLVITWRTDNATVPVSYTHLTLPTTPYV